MRRTRLVDAHAADFPDWRCHVFITNLHEPHCVIDHVIIPELAHRFWQLVNRYPLTDRARGFLIARETG